MSGEMGRGGEAYIRACPAQMALRPRGCGGGAGRRVLLLFVDPRAQVIVMLVVMVITQIIAKVIARVIAIVSSSGNSDSK